MAVFIYTLECGICDNKFGIADDKKGLSIDFSLNKIIFFYFDTGMQVICVNFLNVVFDVIVSPTTKSQIARHKDYNPVVATNKA